MHISEQVRSVIKSEGISEEYLQSMLENAAVTSLSGFNKRFYNWLFKVVGEEIVMMCMDSTIIVGTGEDLMYEDHFDCDGYGCKACGWTGSLGRRITDKPLPKHEPLVFRN